MDSFFRLPATTPHGHPRRHDVTCFTTPELLIHQAVGAVEAAGAHPLLTEAGTLLAEARERFADYLETAAPHNPGTPD
jgi:hypothetical protein